MHLKLWKTGVTWGQNINGTPLSIIYYIFRIFRGNFGVRRMLPFFFSWYDQTFAAVVFNCWLDTDLKIYI